MRNAGPQSLLFVTGVTALALSLALPAAAAGARLKQPDTSAYPVVSVTAVTPAPQARAPRLRENGRPVAGFRAENLGRAKSVVVAVDRSRSMRGQALADAVEAARRFVGWKPAADRLAVVAFGSGATQLTRFSTATIDADQALRSLGVDARSGTALNDAAALAARMLAGEPGGRVLVLLTDGDDEGSDVSDAGALAAVRRAGVAVHAIAIEGETFSPAPLRRLAQATGGSYRGAATSAALADAYAAVASELRRTWRLSYRTAARPGDRVELSSGGNILRVRVPGAPPAVPDRSALLPEAVYTSAAGSLAVGAAVGLLFLLGAILLAGARRGSWLKARLAPHLDGAVRGTQRAAQRERFPLGAAVLRATEAAFGHLQVWRTTQRLLERADVPLRTVEFVYVSAGSAFLLGLVAVVAARGTVTVALALLAGAALPYAYLQLRASKRRKAFDNQLPDLLLTLAASLKAGHSFKQGIQTVVDEGQPPAAKEFQRVLAETRLGRPMEEALADMSERVASKNLDFVITSVTIQGQVGGSLAGLFDMVAEAVRQRQQFARKIKGLTAMGRASAYVLLGLPFVMAAGISAINAQYMAPLWNTGAGHTLLAVGLVMMALGSVLLKKIVSFKG